MFGWLWNSILIHWGVGIFVNKLGHSYMLCSQGDARLIDAMNDRPIMVFVPVWREKDEQLRRTLMVNSNGVHCGDASAHIFIKFFNVSMFIFNRVYVRVIIARIESVWWW